MTNARAAVICSTLLVLAMTPATLAHHSFAAEYDIRSPVTITGTLTELEWTNPHAWIHVDVENPDGAVTPWEVELGSPNTLIRYQWTRETVQIGDVITIEGYMSKDGLDRINAKNVTFPDGRFFQAGSSALTSTR